ncbi:MAG: 16S rRNA (uracil(1498)-N(3))-methyltransferase [Opitutus sp.]|nr:16S rRNA (uracil(1498)-N(3))-methyltransferase [Opitutus sp.]
MLAAGARWIASRRFFRHGQRRRVNLILFEAHELAVPLPREDRRAAHILTVLRRGVGDTFDAGLVNGPRGKATLIAIEATTLTLTFHGETVPAQPDPITLIVGLPRPATARDILRETAALGVAAIHFVATEKGEPSYAQSTLWSSDEWRQLLLAGAAQAFDTRIPGVSHGKALAETIAALPMGSRRIALDNYEAPAALGRLELAKDSPVVVAIGSERGWSAAERATLRAEGFDLAHLGPRVLRVETATIAAVSIIRAKLGLM